MADVSDELRNDSMESERRSLTGAFVRLPDGTAAFILEDQEDRWRFRAFNARDWAAIFCTPCRSGQGWQPERVEIILDLSVIRIIEHHLVRAVN